MAKPSIDFKDEAERDYARKLLAGVGFVKCQTCGDEFVASLIDGKPPICGRCGWWAQKACRKRRVENRKLRKRLREIEAETDAKIYRIQMSVEQLVDKHFDPDIGIRVLNALYVFNRNPAPFWAEKLPVLNTVENLIQWSRDDLLKIRGMGVKSVQFLRRVLAKEGLKLKGD